MELGMFTEDDQPVFYCHLQDKLPYIIYKEEIIHCFEIANRCPQFGNVYFDMNLDTEKKIRYRHHPLRFVVIESLLHVQEYGNPCFNI
jgi:hypothetical protein